MPVLTRSVKVPVLAGELYRYHSRPSSLNRALPPGARVVESAARADGGVIRWRLTLPWAGLDVDWRLEMKFNHASRTWTTSQLQGPFKVWQSTHTCERAGEDRAVMTDRIHYALPLTTRLLLLAPLVKRRVKRWLDFRAQRLKGDMQRLREDRHLPAKTVLVWGAETAFTRDLAYYLDAMGHRVYRLVRKKGGKESQFAMAAATGGDPVHILDRTDILLFTGTAEEQKDVSAAIEQTRFLNRAMRTLDRTPTQLLQLSLPAPALDYFLRDPDLHAHRDAGLMRRLVERDDLLQELGGRVAMHRELHFGLMIGADKSKLLDQLLQLESHLFLKDGAATPEFHWVSQQDAMAAVLFCLHAEEERGDGDRDAMAVAAPGLATRADFQSLLIRHGFWSFTLGRVLRVVPWSKPGTVAERDVRFAQLPNLSAHGFRYRTRELAAAFHLELMGKPPVPAES